MSGPYPRVTADEGATSINVYAQVARVELAGIIDEAHRRRPEGDRPPLGDDLHRGGRPGIDNLKSGIWVATDFTAGKGSGECPPPHIAQTAVLNASWSSIQRLIKILVARRPAITSTCRCSKRSYPLASRRRTKRST